MAKKQTNIKENLTYNEAIAKLKQITSDIDNSELDLDQLITDVKEANQLISFCLNKLKGVEQEMDELISNHPEIEN